MSQSIARRVTHGLHLRPDDVAQGLLDVTHNGFALIGLLVMFIALTLVVRPQEVREMGEARLAGWLLERQGLIGADDPVAEASGPDDGA